LDVINARIVDDNFRVHPEIAAVLELTPEEQMYSSIQSVIGQERGQLFQNLISKRRHCPFDEFSNSRSAEPMIM